MELSVITKSAWLDGDWFKYVDESRGKSINSLLEYCGRLAEAQNDRHYTHGNSYSKWALEYLGIKQSMASMLAKIGNDARIKCIDQVNTLTCDQKYLYELTKLDDESFDEYFESDSDKSRTGLKAHKTAKNKAEREKVPDLPAMTDRYQLHNCACADLPAESQQWIITDPPYPKEFLETYSDLSLLGSRILNPGGVVVCMAGQSYLPEVISRLAEHLTYYWTFAYVTHGQSANLRHKAINTDWKPVLIFVKDHYAGPHVSDTFISDGNDKDHHEWGQSVSGMNDIITRFTNPGDTVIDPFLGGGTTCLSALMNNRYFIGCDVEQSCIDTTLVRIEEWQQEKNSAGQDH